MLDQFDVASLHNKVQIAAEEVGLTDKPIRGFDGDGWIWAWRLGPSIIAGEIQPTAEVRVTVRPSGMDGLIMEVECGHLPIKEPFLIMGSMALDFNLPDNQLRILPILLRTALNRC